MFDDEISKRDNNRYNKRGEEWVGLVVLVVGLVVLVARLPQSSIASAVFSVCE